MIVENVTGAGGTIASRRVADAEPDAFGIFGYVLSKLEFEPAPMLLGFVLGPLLEEYLRRAMTISHGDPTVFVTRPISVTLLVLAVVIFAIALLPSIAKKRDTIFVEED
ncbi:TctA family transporter [Agrobacterium vitis]|nr:TctA family transporter [Agrobacterium vitis]MBE1440485.1 TctA family transporter [Agrobacterium vitis]